MKTIAKLACEFVEKQASHSPDDEKQSLIYLAFIAGAQAAQEWKDATDEEPPMFEPILCLAGSSDYPFVGEFNGKYSIIIRGCATMEYDRLMYWRPIERK